MNDFPSLSSFPFALLWSCPHFWCSLLEKQSRFSQDKSTRSTSSLVVESISFKSISRMQALHRHFQAFWLYKPSHFWSPIRFETKMQVFTGVITEIIIVMLLSMIGKLKAETSLHSVPMFVLCSCSLHLHLSLHCYRQPAQLPIDWCPRAPGSFDWQHDTFLPLTSFRRKIGQSCRRSFHLSYNVLSLSFVCPSQRFLFMLIGLVHLICTSASFFPLAFVLKPMHSSRNVMFALQARLGRDCMKVKYTHHACYETINSHTAGPLCKITIPNLLEGMMCIYIYAYLYILRRIYLKR